MERELNCTVLLKCTCLQAVEHLLMKQKRSIIFTHEYHDTPHCLSVLEKMKEKQAQMYTRIKAMIIFLKAITVYNKHTLNAFLAQSDRL